VFAAHLFVDGAELCRSERTLHVSGSYATRPEQLPRVSYAAFGHIHRPQPIRGLERARYAGSPIQIDYGEEGETKTVVFVDAEPGRTAKVEAIPLSGGRPLRRVEGTLEELEARRHEVGRSILTAIVHSEDAIPDLADRLAMMFPDATLLEAYNPYASGRMAVVAADDDGQAEPSVEELFASYLATAQPNLKGARATRVRDIFTTLLSPPADDATAEFAEAPLFDDDIAAPPPSVETKA
jgi:exonuclease SbcD